MTLIALLKDTDLTGYEDKIEIDTTFNLGVDVVQLIDSSFEWESVSRYYYDVKFFSRDCIEKVKAKADVTKQSTIGGEEKLDQILNDTADPLPIGAGDWQGRRPAE